MRLPLPDPTRTSWQPVRWGMGRGGDAEGWLYVYSRVRKIIADFTHQVHLLFFSTYSAVYRSP